MYELIPVIVLLTAVVAVLAWHFSRSRSVLEQWADKHGFKIIYGEYRNLFRGPFSWTTSEGQTVYYVVVRDRHGARRAGYVRCGGWFFGLMSDKAEVRWVNDNNT